MNPYGIGITGRHEIRQEVSPGDFNTQHISNGILEFVDGVEGQTVNNNQ